MGMDASELGGLGSVPTAAQAPGVGGVGTVHTSSPISGDGSVGTPIALTAASAGILLASAPGAYVDGTGRQALSIIVKDTSFRIDVIGAAVTDIDFTGLLGDSDGDYEGEFWCPGVSDQLKLQPQNLTTNQVFAGLRTRYGVDIALTYATFFLLGDGAATANTGSWGLKSKSGQGNRAFWSQSYDTSGGVDFSWNINGWWADAVTVIDKIRIHCGTPLGIPVGSWFTLRKLGNL